MCLIILYMVDEKLGNLIKTVMKNFLVLKKLLDIYFGIVVDQYWKDMGILI